jgi:hypothetical protein
MLTFSIAARAADLAAATSVPNESTSSPVVCHENMEGMSGLWETDGANIQDIPHILIT